MKAHSRDGVTADHPIDWGRSLAFLKTSVAFIVAGAVAYATALWLFADGQGVRAVLALVFAVVALVARAFLARGRVRAAVWVMGVGVWVQVTIASALLGGMAASTPVIYPLLVLLAGWMFSVRAAVAVALVTAVAGLGLVLADWRGLLPVAPPTLPAMRWFVLCMVLALSATLIGFLVRAYRERVAELRELGADLEQRAALLEASQAELQGVLAATADGILAVDRQGRVLLTNRRFAEFWRIPQSLLDRRDDQVLLGQVLGQLARPEAFLAKVRALYDSEAVDADAIEFTDGRTFECFTAPLMLNGTTVGRVWSFSDITERRQAERELRASEEKFAKAFRASPAFICISTLDEGRYIEVNDAYLRGTGRSREEVVGHTVVESGFWNDPQRRARAIELLRRDGRLAGFEMEARKKSGAIFVCELWGELLEFEGRSCVLWVVNDISERKRAEAEIEKLNASLEERVQARTAELRAANRELESFSYTVSHDLRAPLRSMVGFAGLLSENLMQQLDDENRDYLARIAASGNKMSQLIDGVLEYSRLARSAPARRPVDLDLLVGEVIGELREQYPATEVVVHPLGRVDADPVMIRQIFHNLLDNAFKYSGKSARPCVEVGTQTDTPADTAAGASRSGACYFVRDNGVGFDMRHAEHLFSLFTRLHSDPHFESTGAGLAIVKRLVERHGGSIRAVAAPGRGATFSFCV